MVAFATASAAARVRCRPSGVPAGNQVRLVAEQLGDGRLVVAKSAARLAKLWDIGEDGTEQAHGASGAPPAAPRDRHVAWLCLQPTSHDAGGDVVREVMVST